MIFRVRVVTVYDIRKVDGTYAACMADGVVVGVVPILAGNENIDMAR